MGFKQIKTLVKLDCENPISITTTCKSACLYYLGAHSLFEFSSCLWLCCKNTCPALTPLKRPMPARFEVKPLVTVKCNAEIHTSVAEAQCCLQWVKSLCTETMIFEIFWDLRMRDGLLHKFRYQMSAKRQAIAVRCRVGVGFTKQGVSLSTRTARVSYYPVTDTFSI